MKRKEDLTMTNKEMLVAQLRKKQELNRTLRIELAKAEHDRDRYKAEIERLQDKCEELRNEKWNAQDVLDCYFDEMPNKIKQAKIDVLNELKKYLHPEDFDTPDERWKPESEFCAIIDELIKNIEKQ